MSKTVSGIWETKEDRHYPCSQGIHGLIEDMRRHLYT